MRIEVVLKTLGGDESSLHFKESPEEISLSDKQEPEEKWWPCDLIPKPGEGFDVAVRGSVAILEFRCDKITSIWTLRRMGQSLERVVYGEKFIRRMQEYAFQQNDI